MSGMFENWMHKLVAAVQRRESKANVVVVDWLGLAHQLYPDAVNHTHRVGKSIASLLDWLQVHLYYTCCWVCFVSLCVHLRELATVKTLLVALYVGSLLVLFIFSQESRCPGEVQFVFSRWICFFFCFFSVLKCRELAQGIMGTLME